PVPADTTCADFGRTLGTIQVGQTITAVLGDSTPVMRRDTTHFVRWVLAPQANQTFTVDLTSDDFDSYLWLTKARGESLVQNDDGGGGCNARIVYTAPDNHTLHIIVNTAGHDQSGRYTLKVSDGESPTEPKGNCRFRGATASRAAPAPPAAG